MNHIQLNKKFNDMLHKRLNSKNSPCNYPNCNNKAVNSHAISCETSLRPISRNGKIIAPQSKRNDRSTWKHICFEPVGISDASAYRGFCVEHEKLFYSIDKDGVRTFRDIFLQIYRSVTGYIFRRNITIKTEREVFPAFSNEAGWEESFVVSASNVQSMFADLLVDFPEASDTLIPPHRGSVILEPFSEKQQNVRYKVLFKELQMRSPLANQTFSTLHKDGIYYNSITLIVPMKEKTFVIGVYHESDINEVHNQLLSPIGCLDFMESMAMANGEFLIDPEVASKWSDEKLKAIESDFRFFNERKFFQPYDVSLCDDLRLSLIGKLNDNEREQQLKKIRELPDRIPTEERENRLLRTIIQSKFRRR